MTLGEKISVLRGKNNMSQNDLAEKLNISRQSISKWETNASVPELDKLIAIANLFNITLDELVGRENTENQTYIPKDTTILQTVAPKPISTQKIVGFILLALGLLCCILALLFSRVLFLIGIYVVLCSIVCILAKKHAGLIIGWFSVLQAFILTPSFTGVRLFSVFNPHYYENGFSINHIVAFAIWTVIILLVIFTIKAIKNKKHLN